MPVGIAVVNAQREVLFCNDAMQNVIAHKDALDVQGNRLVALRQEDDRKLDSLVRRSATNTVEAAPNQSFMALPRPAPHAAYGVAIQRMTSDSPSEPVVAIQISEADRGLELSRTAIREFFGLTPTEAEIAARLADGNNINEIATALDIRPGTVRVHLRSIYRKTRVSRQGELVRLVLCSIARFALR
jgi:DNA-binding CsgD family transcriptional regulator